MACPRICLPTTGRTAWTLLLALLTGGLVLAGAAAPAHGQSSDSITIEASADPGSVGTGQPVTFTIRVEGAALTDVETPEPPLTEGLALQRPTPATQRDISFANGRLTRSVTFRWTYEPVRTGRARIHPVAITVRGRSYETDAVEVEVLSHPQRAQQSPGTASGSPRQPSNPSAAPQQRSRPSEENLFIRAEPEARRAYQNEQVTVAYHLYFRDGIQLRHSRLANAWDAAGFWREELDVDRRPIPRSVTVDGQSYQTIVLKRAALFPTHAGSLWVDPLEIETEARATRRLQGRIDPFYPHTYDSIALASDSLMIEAAPLPAGAPDDFAGAVGDFRMQARVEPTEVQVGRPVRLRVRIQGTGNIATLQPPTIAPPDAFVVYDPKENTSINREGTHVRGSKTFTYVLVPRSGGSYTLAPPAFAYFDPEARRYHTLHAAPAEIQVIGDEAPAEATTGGRLPANDVGPIMTETPTWIRTGRRPLYRRPWLYVAVLAPLLLAGGLVALRRSVRTASNARTAPSEETHLQRARHHLHNQQPEACFEAIERAMLTFIGDRIGVAATGLTRAQLDDHLDRHGVPMQARKALYELLDVCDQARYSPAHSSKAAMQSAVRRAEQLIDYLDSKLP